MPPGLANPSEIANGRYDCDHLSPWAKWQGALNAEIVLVGQDWADSDFFVQHKGIDPDDNPTNMQLRSLFRELGIEIGTPSHPTSARVYFTNSILGMKIGGGMAGKVRQSWANAHVRTYTAPLISRIIKPRLVIAMGGVAFTALTRLALRNRAPGGIKANAGKSLPANIGGHDFVLFPVAHCSGLGLVNRGLEAQKQDWRNMRSELVL